MAAGKYNRLVIRCAKAPDDAIGARADIRRLLAVRASVAEQEPAGPAGEDFAGLAPLVVAVIPFEQVGIDLCGVAEPGERAGAGRALKGTGEYPVKLEPLKTLVEASRLAFALFREANIRASRMLAARAPFGFAMADKIDTGKHGDSNPRLRRQWGAEDGNILLRLAPIWICDQWALSNVMSRREGSCSRESELLLDRGGRPRLAVAPFREPKPKSPSAWAPHRANEPRVYLRAQDQHDGFVESVWLKYNSSSP